MILFLFLDFSDFNATIPGEKLGSLDCNLSCIMQSINSQSYVPWPFDFWDVHFQNESHDLHEVWVYVKL